MARPTVLLVDDEPGVTAALRRILARAPYRIVCAESAAEALAILEGEDVDVIVSDECMPGMSGSRFLAVVHERWPETARILLTGHADLDVAMRAINEGRVFRFLTKPCSDLDLLVSVRQALQMRALASSGRRLLRELRRQERLIERLEAENPGITCIRTDGDGAIVLDDEDGDIESLLEEMNRQLATRDAERRR